MATSKIDPYKMAEESSDSNINVNGQTDSKTVSEKDKFSGQSVHASLNKDKESTKFFIGDRDSFDGQSSDAHLLKVGSEVSSVNENGTGCVTPISNELDDQQKCDMRRGVQLLRFHSHMDPHANTIPFKVNLLHKESSASMATTDPHLCSAQSTHGRNSVASDIILGPQNHGSKSSAQSTHGRNSVVSDVVAGAQNQALPKDLAALGYGNGQDYTPSVLLPHGREAIGSTSSSFGPQRPTRVSDYRLSDVPEESPTEKEQMSLSRRNSRPAQAQYSLRDAEEGRVGNGHPKTSLEVPHNIPKAGEVGIKQMSEAGFVYTPQQSTSLSLGMKRSSCPPPLDLNITRSLSEGRLENMESDEMGCNPPTPGTLRRSILYSSEQSLLHPNTPSTATRPLNSDFSFVLPHRNTNIFKNLSRKLSHNVDRNIPPTMAEEVSSLT